MNTSSSSLGAFLIFVGFAVVIVNYLRKGNMSSLWGRWWTEQQNQSNPRASKRWPVVLGLVMLILAGLWISVSDKSSKTVQSTSKAVEDLFGSTNVESTPKADRAEQPNIATPKQTAEIPLEQKMADINAGRRLPSSDITVARFRFLMKALSEASGEEPQRIADLIAWYRKEYGKQVSLLDLTEAVYVGREWIKGGQTNAYLAVWSVLIGNDNDRSGQSTKPDTVPNIITPEQTAHVYAYTMANAMPSLAQGLGTISTACVFLSAVPIDLTRDLNRCGLGADIVAASIRAVQNQMSSLAVPDCLRNVDARLRHALGLLSDGYSTIRQGISAQNMTIVDGAMPDLDVGNRELNETAKLLKTVVAAGTCRSQ